MLWTEKLETLTRNARTNQALDEAQRLIWRGVVEGALGEEDANRLDMMARTRRAEIAARSGGLQTVGEGAGRRWPDRAPPRSPDREASARRRRRVSSSGAMPPSVAEALTESERAALAAIGHEARGKGTCAKCIDAIAAMAGVARSSVKRALVKAEALGLILRELRPRPGRKHLPSILRILDRDWRRWLGLDRKKTHRGRDRGPALNPHEYQRDNRGAGGPDQCSAVVSAGAYTMPESSASLARAAKSWPDIP